LVSGSPSGWPLAHQESIAYSSAVHLLFIFKTKRKAQPRKGSNLGTWNGRGEQGGGYPMPGPISQSDMGAIFAVTDAMDIHREEVVVPLGRKDPGSVRKMGNQVQITLPASLSTAEWAATLRSELEKLGYEAEEDE
jgi:hypothetical protein